MKTVGFNYLYNRLHSIIPLVSVLSRVGPHYFLKGDWGGKVNWCRGRGPQKRRQEWLARVGAGMKEHHFHIFLKTRLSMLCLMKNCCLLHGRCTKGERHKSKSETWCCFIRSASFQHTTWDLWVRLDAPAISKKGSGIVVSSVFRKKTSSIDQ